MAIIAEAVRVSVQSLLNAYVERDCGDRGFEEIVSAGSSHFDALKLIPVFVENDHQDYFNGRWTRYAEFIERLTDSGIVPTHWQSCAMQYVDGGLASLPWSGPNACTTFPAFIEPQIPADMPPPVCSAAADWGLTEWERDASDWLASHPDSEIAAIDEFLPGIANGGGCLDPGVQELVLDGGRITLTPTGDCAVLDGSTPSAVSDAVLETLQYVTLDFSPPIEAFYANFASVRERERIRLWLNPDDRDYRVLETAPSPDDVYAFGHGFASHRPIRRIIVQGSGMDLSLMGASVGLVTGEPSLGQAGPAGEHKADFGVVFSSSWIFEDGLE